MNKEELNNLSRERVIELLDNQMVYTYILQQENQQLIEKYNKRSKKWEKWETEKSILSTRMSEYLCKYQNIKREYNNQIANATKKKKEIEKLHNKIDKAIETIESYNLGKYDYSIPPIGIIELLEILKGDVDE